MNRRHLASGGLESDHARIVIDAVMRKRRRRQVARAATHIAFDRNEGIGRIERLLFTRAQAHFGTAIGVVVHHGGQQHLSLRIRQTLR